MRKLLWAALFGSLCLSPALAGGPSTSPHPVFTVPLPQEGRGKTTITFSEFPVGTPISNQYQDLGVLFSGDDPFITTDGSNPDSPVLSGTPLFFGKIVVKFIRPATGKPRPLSTFAFEAGYFDSLNSVVIRLFDKNGKEVASLSNTKLGIQRFKFKNLKPKIASFQIKPEKDEPAGFAIDNVQFPKAK
jgi:hypothetical protein